MNYIFYAVIWKMKYIPSDYKLVIENNRPIIFNTYDKAIQYASEKFDNNEYTCATVIEVTLIKKNTMPIFKILFRAFLRGRGYSREQAKRLANQLDWETIRAAIIKYGPILLKIFLALLPLIIAKEAPDEIVAINESEEEQEWNFNYTEMIKNDI